MNFIIDVLVNYDIMNFSNDNQFQNKISFYIGGIVIVLTMAKRAN